MEDVTKIQKKVEKPASTSKAEIIDNGLVLVEYTRKSEKYKMRTTMSRHLAGILEKRGIVTIVNKK